jgi:hypothetical protein
MPTEVLSNEELTQVSHEIQEQLDGMLERLVRLEQHLRPDANEARSHIEQALRILDNPLVKA